MKTVGIIGGTGAMGGLFAPVFSRAGFDVEISGRTTPLSNRDLAMDSDIVIISVPIRETVKVIEEIAPFLSADQVLCDFTSLKVKPIAAMLGTPAQVLGLHPMFGPGVASLAGQTVIATPARCASPVCTEILDVFRNEGARVTITTPEEHDRIMAVIQGLMHFSTLVVAETMRSAGVSPVEMQRFTSPVYRIETGIVGRILGQEADLYGPILQENPEVGRIVSSFVQASERLAEIVTGGDTGKFDAFFAANREFFLPVIPESTDVTDRLIASLVNP
ncbi:prephenate dehydrogenase [Methanomicrobiaceae archaeon CYW5]|uniref:prephenate dehydrogenase/arogenate dehydrogenase family protein n=1 Tax=Methanovulcanius yangii TaxID=1789227 RepID=UPI0029C9CA3F|nr:prephenate dehydrogenase/arogenate dehydrogenase family protein [Methanovulcanius yangii]MBT8508064.1 prephenate dehydrogenase [Methanovulcanius yangii]